MFIGLVCLKYNQKFGVKVLVLVFVKFGIHDVNSRIITRPLTFERDLWLNSNELKIILGINKENEIRTNVFDTHTIVN